MDTYQGNLLTSFYSERATLAAMSPTAPNSLLKAFGSQPGVKELLGLKNVGTSALIVTTGYKLHSDTIEEARHTVNMMNPVYAAPYHFVEALKADERAKAEGRTFENELPVIEHSFGFAMNTGAVVAPFAPKLKFGTTTSTTAVEATVVESRAPASTVPIRKFTTPPPEGQQVTVVGNGKVLKAPAAGLSEEELARIQWEGEGGALETGPHISNDARAASATSGTPVARQDLPSGVGYGAGDAPVRIEGPWTVSDLKQGVLGHPPRSLGSPDIHHGGQMPGAARHEIAPPMEHRANPNLHPNPNQGVTGAMREADRQLHWWYRAREQGADALLPDWIYDK